MVSTAAVIALAGSAIVLVGWGYLVAREQRRGQRLLLSGARTWLDRVLDRLLRIITTRVRHVYRYVFQLQWYYGLHSILKTVLRVVVGLYTVLEDRFEHNRRRTKALRKERQQQAAISHLTAMAAHKEETALTQKEQERRRRASLEG